MNKPDTPTAETPNAETPKAKTLDAKAPRAKSSNGKISGLAARQIALQFLGFVVHNRLTFDDALLKIQTQTNWAKLSDRDQAFVRNLIITSLRHYTKIEYFIKLYMKKTLPRKAYLAHYILVLGAAQLLYLETPPHAAISLSLHLADTNDAKHFKKLINAILGKVNREQDKLRFLTLTAHQMLPNWLADKWTDYYGETITLQLAHAMSEPPKMDLTVKSNAAEWAKKLDATQIGDATIRLNQRQSFTKLDGYEDGEFWAQDAAAAIATQLFDDVKGQPVLDFCAAPGGKTMQLANLGAEVTAVDINKNRLKRLTENLARTKLKAEIVQTDIRKYAPDTPPTHILLDAPCSATGTLRKHPDILLLKNLEDIKKLTLIQADLLNKTIDMAAPNAEIIYAVCSLEPEEGEKQIDAILGRRNDVKIEPITMDQLGLIGQTADLKIAPKGWLRILPNIADAVGGIDGFFMAKLRKL
ncbi:MAG: methyltransferase domain-containing protein [Hyphomicrobiales bacterium]|nr:methyltransferase domain-containing protein [Hyphomicrobiales bacterium]